MESLRQEFLDVSFVAAPRISLRHRSRLCRNTVLLLHHHYLLSLISFILWRASGIFYCAALMPPGGPKKKGGAGGAPKPSPFENIMPRSKFSVLNRGGSNQKKAENVVKARTEAINKRKQSLLVEYQSRNKSNSFIDQRFGETDNSLTSEDKFMHRFQAERAKQLSTSWIDYCSLRV